MPVFDMQDSLSCSNDTLLYYQDVDFVFRDRCQHALVFTKRFAIYDDSAPQIISFPKDTSYILDPDECSEIVVLEMPEALDNCTGKEIEIIRSVTKPIKSQVQGSYTVPVDPVTLNIGPFSESERNPEDILNFNLHFTNNDADDIGVYFFIIGENNDTLGITPNVAAQCGDKF
ncbi:MAG: hypothetical protein R2771_12035 [Saprospiraceae bacterium]